MSKKITLSVVVSLTIDGKPSGAQVKNAIEAALRKNGFPDAEVMDAEEIPE